MDCVVQCARQSCCFTYSAIWNWQSLFHCRTSHLECTTTWHETDLISHQFCKKLKTLFQSYLVKTFILVLTILLLIFFSITDWHCIVRHRWAPVRGTLLVFMMMMMMMRRRRRTTTTMTMTTTTTMNNSLKILTTIMECSFIDSRLLKTFDN